MGLEVGIAGPGDDLCLAFANTRYWRGTEAPVDELCSADDLLRWAAGSGGAPGGLVDRVAKEWAGRPELGEQGLRRAVEWREAIYDVFAGAASGRGFGEGELGRMNRVLAEAPRRGTLRAESGGLGWMTEGTALSSVLAPVLWSAGDLLAGPRLGRVRRCENPRCLWMFLDDSKAGTRRWCSMSACGNRAKAHRHYLRKTGRA